MCWISNCTYSYFDNNNLSALLDIYTNRYENLISSHRCLILLLFVCFCFFIILLCCILYARTRFLKLIRFRHKCRDVSHFNHTLCLSSLLFLRLFCEKKNRINLTKSAEYFYMRKNIWSVVIKITIRLCDSTFID